MKLLAVFLLTVLLSGLISLNEANIDATHVPLIKSNHLNDSLEESLTETKAISEKESYSTNASVNERAETVDDKDALKLKKDDFQFMKNFLNPKDMLMQEIHTLNEESKVICIFLY